MALRDKCRRWNLIAFAPLLLIVSAGQASTKHEAAAAPTVTPTVRIAVGPLGFMAPSEAYLQHRMAWATLDFVDDSHLLFTFHSSGLMRRIPGDPADDEDQMIHAVVLEIATGKVTQQADWRMHDRQRYLWALQDGKFLVRQRNSLYLTDSNLELRPYLTFDTDLEAIEVSPGRTLMAIEMVKFLAPAAGESDTLGDVSGLLPPSLVSPGGIRQKRTELVLVHPGDKKAVAAVQMRNPMDLPLLEDGFLGALEGTQPKEWVIEKQLSGGDMEKIGEVKSMCRPDLVTLSANVALSENCPVNGADGYAVSALSMAGEVLWQGLWQSKYIWASFEVAENGSRFAYGSLETNRDIGRLDAFGEADVVAQPVGVFDTETGKLEVVKNASPILSGAHNFALSADGRRFAILRDGAIEVYDLPPVPMDATVKDKAEAK